MAVKFPVRHFHLPLCPRNDSSLWLFSVGARERKETAGRSPHEPLKRRENHPRESCRHFYSLSAARSQTRLTLIRQPKKKSILSPFHRRHQKDGGVFAVEPQGSPSYTGASHVIFGFHKGLYGRFLSVAKIGFHGINKLKLSYVVSVCIFLPL